jgi:hypothetical protein
MTQLLFHKYGTKPRGRLPVAHGIKSVTQKWDLLMVWTNLENPAINQLPEEIADSIWYTAGRRKKIAQEALVKKIN